MTTLVFIESADGKVKKTSLEAVAYAHAMGGTVVAMVAAKLSWWHLFLVPFAIFLAWGGTAWLRRKFREIGEMWRRSHS